MRLAYLTTAYPEVSHTFIRREIAELERRGHEVLRLSVRRPTSRLVDPRDLAEAGRTLHLLASPIALARATLAALARPGRFARALGLTLRMARKSDRGLVRHLAYLVEACLVCELLIRHAAVHVHVHFGTNAAAVARLAHALGGPPWSMTVHGPDEFDAPIGLALGEKVQDAAFTAAISHFCVAQLQRWTPPEAWGRITLVRCSVGDDFEAAGAAPPPQASRFVCVGRLSAQKGQQLLLDAMAKLVAEGCDARLVLAGDGELRPVLEAHAQRLGISGRVEITGWISSERVRELLCESRALVLPSFAEGLPVVILEAFALARPVIATYVGGIPELVEPGRSGWLVPAGSLEALVAAMREVLALPGEALAEMGRVGRERVLAQHGTRAAVDALEARLFAAVGGTGASGPDAAASEVASAAPRRARP